jgi:hypothetical protein
VKVLLDENLDHALRTLLEPHEVVTAAYMGWAGLTQAGFGPSAGLMSTSLLPTSTAPTCRSETESAGERLKYCSISSSRIYVADIRFRAFGPTGLGVLRQTP